jgi:hypothetical protein
MPDWLGAFIKLCVRKENGFNGNRNNNDGG